MKCLPTLFTQRVSQAPAACAIGTWLAVSMRMKQQPTAFALGPIFTTVMIAAPVVLCSSTANALEIVPGTWEAHMSAALDEDLDARGSTVEVKTFDVKRREGRISQVTVYGMKNGELVGYNVAPWPLSVNEFAAMVLGVGAAVFASPLTPLAIVIGATFGTIGGMLWGAFPAAALLGVLGAAVGFAFPFFVGSAVRKQLASSSAGPLMHQALDEMRADGFDLTERKQKPPVIKHKSQYKSKVRRTRRWPTSGSDNVYIY